MAGEPPVPSSEDELRERHLKIVRAIQAKALEALRTMPVANARDAIRALERAARLEAELLAGTRKPPQRSVESIIRDVQHGWAEPKTRRNGRSP